MVLYNLKNRLVFQTVFFIIATIEMLLVTGITFGWPSITYVFGKEGFFSYLCDGNSVAYNVSKSNYANRKISRYDAYTSCSSQKKRFNLVFNIAVAFFCCASFPTGLFIDKFGPRSGQAFGCTLYFIAGLGLAFVNKETSNLLFPIFILFCVGGGFISLSAFQMCRFYFTSVRSLVLSILTGTFDSSAVILLFFKLAWEGGYELRDISLVYIAISCMLVVTSIFALSPPYKTLLAEAKVEEKQTDCKHSSESYHMEGKREQDMHKNLIPEEEKSPDSLKDTVLSAMYLLELMFLCFCQLRLWFFIGSLDELLALHFPAKDSKSIDLYNTYFGYAQLCGILVGPMIGVAFDRNTIKCRGEKEAGKDLDKTPLLNENTYTRAMKIEASVLPFFMTNCLCLAFSVLSLGPWNWALVPSFVLHVLTRGFLYAAHASFIALAFRPERFATLYGLGIFTSGVFGMLEYPLYSIVYNYCHSDPFLVNLILLFVVLSSNIFPLYLIFYCKRKQKTAGKDKSKWRLQRREVAVKI